MKFLAFVDLHQDLADIEAIKFRIEHDNPEFLICAGDFTIFGNKLDQLMEILNDLGKPLYLIHGNHETESELKKKSLKYKNINFSHKKIIDHKNVTMVFFGGGGFSETEPQFTKFIKKNEQKILESKNIILITHAPAKDTVVDNIGEEKHVGVKDFKEFIIKYKPVLAISGHIHESYKAQEFIGETLVINPGWDGEVFEI